MSNMSEKADNNLKWVARLAVTVALAVIGWFVVQWAQDTRQMLADQSEFNRSVEKRLHALEVDASRSEATQFTMPQWAAAKSVLDERAASFDKRITRLEDAIPQIRDALLEIKNNLSQQRKEAATRATAP